MVVAWIYLIILQLGRQETVSTRQKKRPEKAAVLFLHIANSTLINRFSFLSTVAKLAVPMKRQCQGSNHTNRTYQQKIQMG
jgi:hypothetical protein